MTETVTKESISQRLKYIFLVHIFIGLGFGIPYLLFPVDFLDLFDQPVLQPAVWRIAGAAVTGFAIASWFGYRAKEWLEVKILVIAEVIWTSLATVATIWGIIDDDLENAAWLNVVILGFFAVAFGYEYYKMEIEK